MGIAITIVIRIIMIVFTMFPAIPTVPLRTLVTDVRKEILIVDMPFTSTYTMIPISKSTENKEHI